MFHRTRVRASHVLVTTCLPMVCIVVACDRPDAFRTGDAEIQYAPQVGPTNEGRRLPLVSCVDSFSSKRTLSLAAQLEPDEFVTPDESGRPTWTPVEIVDAAALDSGFVILDRAAAEVTLVSNELQVLRTWGRRGGGPAEFQSPAAVTVVQSGDTIWVLDAAPPRLVGFDRMGRFQRDFRVPGLGIDVTTERTWQFLHCAEADAHEIGSARRRAAAAGQHVQWRWNSATNSAQCHAR